MKILQIREEITEKRNQIVAIVDACKAETRDLTEEEQAQVDELTAEIEAKKEEIKALEDEMDKLVPAEAEIEEEKNQRNKNINVNKMKNLSLVKEIRQAIDENKKSVIVNAETRAVQVTGQDGVHDQVVETEITGILEPLYANSVLTKLGARWFTGLPMGDVQIPVMGKGNVGWEGEIDEAQGTGNTFTTVKLQPKRLSAYVDISKMLIAQDNIGVENAIRRDIVNALNDKLEATLFGDDAATTEQPAGLFYNQTPEAIADYEDLCEFEAGVEENNVYGDMKYVLSPAAKAKFRAMIKGTNATGMVYEAGEMDGITSYVTTNVAKGDFIYANFNNLVVGSWGDIEITIDPYTQATKGCVRLVVNAYFDFKPARDVAFAFGTINE